MNSKSTVDHSLQVCDVCMKIGDKAILQNVSVTARSGAMLAVMGPSGSGKTSLMNLICGRLPANSSMTGDILLDGKPIRSRNIKAFGYVTQEDVFFPQLTLRQTLWFYAQVKLSSKMTSKQKSDRVDEVVDMLELKKCLGTKMGDSTNKGLSGGEKKRANIACELLRRPAILLLDEPTSGLDASLALKVVQILANWSNTMNSIVLASIHQPSSQTFHQFTDLLLLTDGQIGFRGVLTDMPQYFRSIGVQFNSDWNAADSMLEAVKESSESKELIIEKGKAFVNEAVKDVARTDEVHVNLGYTQSQANVKELQPNAESFTSLEMQSGKNGYSIKDSSSGGSSSSNSSSSSSWFTQFLALSFRAFLVSKDSILSIHVVVQSLFVAAVASIMWFQLNHIEENISEFFAAIFFVTSYMVFAPFFDAIMTFYSDLLVVKHERKSGMYRISAYYMAKMLVDIPLLLVMPIVILTPTFWLIGLGPFSVYIAFLAVVTLNSLASQGIGIMFSLFTENARTNMTFAFLFMIFCFLTGGFFSTRIPIWFDWSKYLSYIRYCYHFALILIMQNINDFQCSTTHPSAYAVCIGTNSLTTTASSTATSQSANVTAIITGHNVLQQHPDSFLPQWVNVVVAVFMFFGFRIGGYILLRFCRKV